MESAIDTHLKCPRTLSRRVAEDYEPPFAMFVGRGDVSVQQVVSDGKEQTFEYINCHPRTGMMRDARMLSSI